MEAGCNLAEAVERECLGLVPRGGFDELVEWQRAEGGGDFQAFIESKRRSSEGSVRFQDGSAMLHDDFQATEQELATAKP